METAGYSRFARHAFSAVWPGRSFLDPDEARLALLALLAEALEMPMHGYQLMRRLEERFGSRRTTAGIVYPMLHQLEDEGLITSERREGKTVYTLTEVGKRELAEKDEAVRQTWHRTPRSEEWRSSFADAERLIREAFRTVTGKGASEAQIQRVREILQRALHELEELGRPQ